MSLTKWVKPYRLLSEEGVADLITEALRRVQPYHPPKHDVIYVTEAVQPCMRRMYLERLHPRPPSIATVTGEYLHNLLQQVLKRLGYVTEFGVAKNLGDFKLTGRVDAVWQDDFPHIIEIKTVSQLPKEPYATHIKQLRVYMSILEVPCGYLVYLDRNKGKTAIHMVQPDPSALEEALKNARVLWKALNDHVPPQKHEGAWCVFCPFRRECRRVDRAVMV